MGTTEVRNYWTFTFKVDPLLNQGAVKAFNQGGEPWWWAVDSNGEIMGAGEVDFTGASFVSLVHSEAGKNTYIVGYPMETREPPK